MGVHPYDDVTFGLLNAQIQRSGSRSFRIVYHLHGWMTCGYLFDFLSCPISTQPIDNKNFNEIFRVGIGKNRTKASINESHLVTARNENRHKWIGGRLDY